MIFALHIINCYNINLRKGGDVMYYIGLNGERLVKERVSKEQVDELYKEYMDIYGECIPKGDERTLSKDEFLNSFKIE